MVLAADGELQRKRRVDAAVAEGRRKRTRTRRTGERTQSAATQPAAATSAAAAAAAAVTQSGTVAVANTTQQGGLFRSHTIILYLCTLQRIVEVSGLASRQTTASS